jgi:hypothetical protein
MQGRSHGLNWVHVHLALKKKEKQVFAPPLGPPRLLIVHCLVFSCGILIDFIDIYITKWWQSSGLKMIYRKQRCFLIKFFVLL